MKQSIFSTGKKMIVFYMFLFSMSILVALWAFTLRMDMLRPQEVGDGLYWTDAVLREPVKKAMTIQEVYEALYDALFPPTPDPSSSANVPVLDSVRPPISVKVTEPLKYATIDPNGYIAYLPHSGFSNQLMELENALITARVLDRTLVLPPAYIGHLTTFAWRPYDELKWMLRNIEMLNYNKLLPFLKHSGFWSTDDVSRILDESNPIAIVPWSAVIDLNKLARNVKVIDIPTFMKLNLLKTKDDVVQIKDHERYAYKMVDRLHPASKYLIDDHDNHWNLTVLHPEPFHSSRFNDVHNSLLLNTTNAKGKKIRYDLSHYSHVIDLHVMKRINKRMSRAKLIQLGSMFGASRIHLQQVDNANLTSVVQDALHFSNPIVDSIADKIIDMLGGRNQYIAIHLRLGDGGFLTKAQGIVKRAVAEINKFVRGRQNSFIYISTDIDSFDDRQNLLKPFQKFSNRIRFFSDFRNMTITELPRLDEWREQALLRNNRNANNVDLAWYGDMTTLIDSVELVSGARVIHQSDHVRRQIIRELAIAITRNNSDSNTKTSSSHFAELWIPFFEQTVCSRAHTFIGTEGSTFSNIIVRMFNSNSYKLHDDSRTFKYI